MGKGCHDHVTLSSMSSWLAWETQNCPGAYALPSRRRCSNQVYVAVCKILTIQPKFGSRNKKLLASLSPRARELLSNVFSAAKEPGPLPSLYPLGSMLYFFLTFLVKIFSVILSLFLHISAYLWAKKRVVGSLTSQTLSQVFHGPVILQKQ